MNACSLLAAEKVPVYRDEIWLRIIPSAERRIFQLEQQNNISIHALLFRQVAKQRMTPVSIAIKLRIPISAAGDYIRQLNLPPNPRKARLSEWIPFDLSAPPSREEITEHVAHYGIGTPETIRFLCNQNLRLLPNIAAKFNLRKCIGLDHEDLVQEGYWGLLAAARRFDPEKGPFGTLAYLAIKQKMINAIVVWTRKGGGKKRVSLGQRQLENLSSYHWDPFDILGKPGDPDFEDTLATAIIVADNELDAREKTVLNFRFPLDGSKPKSRDYLAEKIGLSGEGIRLIEIRALRKIAKRFAQCGLTAQHVFD